MENPIIVPFDPFNEETESFIRKKFDMPIPDESKEP